VVYAIMWESILLPGQTTNDNMAHSRCFLDD